MRGVSLKGALRILKKRCPTLVVCHVNPDADAIGSSLALCLLLRKLGSEAYCVCADEIPSRLAFLAEGLQQSLLLENQPITNRFPRVIAVDTASPRQMGALWERLAPQIALMIDHHESGTPYADHLILPKAAAAGEIVLELYRKAKVKPSRTAAGLLYAAISGDTGGFRYSNVRPETHLAAAELIGRGIDSAEINRLLFESKSPGVLRAEAAALRSLQTFDAGKIAAVTLSYDTISGEGLDKSELSTAIDVARSVAGVRIAFALRQTVPEPVFHLSMRANADVDVAAICATFGGGGHRRAAGATLEGVATTVEEARELVLAAIRQKGK